MLEVESLFSHLSNVSTSLEIPMGGPYNNVSDPKYALKIKQTWEGEVILEAKLPRQEKDKAIINIRYDLLAEPKKKEILEGRFESLNANVDQ